MNVNNKIIANPSIIVICLGFGGTLLFSFFTYLSIYNSGQGINDSCGGVGMATGVIFFSCMALGTFYKLLTIKRIILHNGFLTISYPLVFYKKVVELSTIKKVTEDNYKHTKMLLDGSTITRYNGKKLILQLSNNENVTITSFEINNYLELSKNFKILLNNKFNSKVKNKSSINV